ncbi:MAG: hypothetical protein JWQ87_5120 [Candidatus Sulfotelmatobacter sp.]|nr:hypothetical protein [Candidatus Sulfotelmatobacter sp.]
MKYSPQFVRLFCVLAILAPLAVPQETHRSHEGGSWSQAAAGTLAAARNVRVKLDMGSVIVRGGPQQGITYVVHAHSYSSEDEARRQFGSFKINAVVKGDTAWVVGEWQGGGHPHGFAGELVINIPRDTDSLKIETGGGGVEAAGISGHLEIESGGGKIRVDDIGGSVGVETGGDSIEIGTVGGDLKLETGGGNITIKSVKGKINAETGGGNVVVLSGEQGAVVEAGGGNVDIKRCMGRVKASTGGGNINLGEIGGPADIDTGGGSIRLTSAKGRVGANTGAGSIELYGVPSARVETGGGGIKVKFINTGAERSDSMLETSAGDITVYIAADVAMSIRASVDLGNGHHITSDFPDIHIASEGDKWGPRSLSADGKLNGGGPVLKVRTTSGDICFKRANQ